MEVLQSGSHQLHFNTGLAPLAAFLEATNYSKVFVFVDTHTAEHCLPVFRELLGDFDAFDLIETDAGEENKNIDFCIGIWKTLLDFEADRKSLLINLGGGVVTDMGGFVASTYMRGIDFINIPTSLLAQVDASVGGKTGIDIDLVKNMVGTFAFPKMVLIEHRFLQTLPERELRAGFAEMIKHGLIADAAYYKQLKDSDYHSLSADLVYRSVQIKNEVVTADPNEKGLRKILNFGHTIGHAVESYSLANDKKPLNHGEAIAIGMICEAYLSYRIGQLSDAELEDLSQYIRSVYPAYQIKPDSFDALLTYMQSDKKNEGGTMLLSVLNGIGNCTFNCAVSREEVMASFAYYNS